MQIRVVLVNNHFLPAPVYARSWPCSRCILVRLEIPGRPVFDVTRKAAEDSERVAAAATVVAAAKMLVIKMSR